MCLPPVTKSAQVTWYKQAKGVQPEKMHMPNASNLEENCVPTTSHKVCSSDMAQASQKVCSHKRCICYMHQTQRKSVCLPPVTKSVQVTWYKQAKGVQLEKMHRASTKRKSVSASKIVKGRAPVKTRAKRPPTGCQLESTQLALQ